MQAGDEADLGRTVVLVDQGRLVMLDLEQDGRCRTGKSLVDALGQGTHRVLVVAVFVDARAAGRRDLDEGELPDALRIEFEQSLDGKKALDDALGVVEPVDADADQLAGRQPLSARTIAPAVDDGLADHFIDGRPAMEIG